MPIEYPAAGGGVLAEHLAVRERVGLFDVSHLGKIEVSGTGCNEFLNSVFTNDLNRIDSGQAQYTLMCDPVSGGVIDDLIIYRRSATEFLLIPNAANAAEVLERLNSNAAAGITITNRHYELGVLALQGPLSKSVLSSLGLVIELPYMSFAMARLAGCNITICRTGYTGEHGYELIVNWSDCLVIWKAIESEVRKFDGRIAGLGARDTLRTEMGYPLHGHELSRAITPVTAGVSWAIGWNKSEFWADSLLRAERTKGSLRTLRGLKLTERGIPRAGMHLLRKNEIVGEITSGTFSPTLKTGIALALIDTAIPIGNKLDVDIRGRAIEAEVVKPPFVPSRVRQ